MHEFDTTAPQGITLMEHLGGFAEWVRHLAASVAIVRTPCNLVESEMIRRNVRAHRAWTVVLVGSPAFASWISATSMYGFVASPRLDGVLIGHAPRKIGALDHIPVYADPTLPHQTGYLARRPRAKRLIEMELIG